MQVEIPSATHLRNVGEEFLSTLVTIRGTMWRKVLRCGWGRSGGSSSSNGGSPSEEEHKHPMRSVLAKNPNMALGAR
jgi:hypothetical protein